MSEDNQITAQMFQQFLVNKLTREELEIWYARVGETSDEEMFGLLDGRFAQIDNTKSAEAIDWDFMFSQVVKQQTKVPVRNIIWRRLGSAAAIVIFFVAGTFFLWNKYGKTKNNPVAVIPVNKAVVPGGDKAVLTLANGSTLILENLANGTVAKEGSVDIIKNKDEIVYPVAGESQGNPVYNSLSTPRGGQYKLLLPDGSRVWLNSASSIHYPTVFTGSQRKVEITGEVCFEVAKNPAFPFIVNVAGKAEVEVLGTHFNVNAYSDEPSINTTLLEGSIKLSDYGTRQSTLLKPGQQGRVSNGIRVIKGVDADAAAGWTNGKFIFDGADIETIMRQLGRWYDADIVYEGKKSKESYSAIINRNSSFQELINIMSHYGVELRLEGRKIIVR